MVSWSDKIVRRGTDRCARLSAALTITCQEETHMTAPPRVSDLTPLISRSVPFLLHCAAFHSTRCVADALAPTGIEPRHFGVLCTLRSSGPQSQGWIGERLGIDRTTMVQLVDELERRGPRGAQAQPERPAELPADADAGGRGDLDSSQGARRGQRGRQVLAALDDDERDALRELLARVVHRPRPTLFLDLNLRLSRGNAAEMRWRARRATVRGAMRDRGDER